MAPRNTTTKYAADGTPLPTRKEFYKRYIGIDLSAEELQKRVDAQMARGGFSGPLPPPAAPAFSSPSPDAQKNPPAPSKPASVSPKPASKPASKPAPTTAKAEDELASKISKLKVDDEPMAIDFPWIPKPAPKPATPQAQLDHYHEQFGGLPREKFSAYVSAESKRIKDAGGWEAVEDNEAFLDSAKWVHAWIDED